MAPFVEGLRARGIDATAIDLPKRKAEDALPAFHLAVPSEADVAIGGHSFGGRVASLAAAEPGAPYLALVCFSYPLHPPGSPDRTDARIAHWPAIRCPVLLLSGESDPFARIDLLRRNVAKLPHGGAGHLPAPRAHAQAGPRRRARSDRGVPPRSGGALTGAGRERRPASDRSMVGVVPARVASYPDRPPRPGAARAPPEPTASTSRSTTRSGSPRPARDAADRDPADARRAQRAVPVGRSSIASAVRPPQGGLRRPSRGDAAHRHPRPDGHLRQRSARPRPLHVRPRPGRIGRQLHRPEPAVGRLRQVPDHALELAGMGGPLPR